MPDESAFDAQFKATAAPTLMEQFGVTVVYEPRQGSPREVQAMVTWMGLDEPYEMPGVLVPTATVEFLNDAADGVLFSEISKNGDHVRLPDRPGSVRIVLMPIVGFGQTDNQAMVTVQLGRGT